MLMLIESDKEKENVQRILIKTLKANLETQGKRKIGFRVGSGEENPKLSVYSNGDGRLWFSSMLLNEAGTPRHWNAFGLFDSKKQAQAISVELNITTDSNTKQVGGFFAKDTENGLLYLLHSGRVGGGKRALEKVLSSSREKHHIPSPSQKRVVRKDLEF